MTVAAFCVLLTRLPYRCLQGEALHLRICAQGRVQGFVSAVVSTTLGLI